MAWEIYTDGATSGNGSKCSHGGFAYVVYYNNKLVDVFAKYENNTTNNICELKAIIAATAMYGKENPIIYSDSAYAINSLTVWKNQWKRRGWKKADGGDVKNLDLILLFEELEDMGYHPIIKKVSGHNDIEGNELADKLATGNITIKEILK